jgi:drug/metabolite transporter (DMT)-like permease
MSTNSVGIKSYDNATRALMLKEEVKKRFFKKGVSIALFSGLMYGLYTALLTMGMSSGVWADWYGPNKAGLSAFVIIYLVAALGNTLNDLCSAVWAIANAVMQGKFKDFLRSINTKPGRQIMVAALMGGPIAGTAYVVALQMAGSIIVPITALCPAIAAILGKIFYKQEINKRMAFGIFICVFATFLIGSTGLTGGISISIILGLFIALIAAFGWGLEGCLAGYASAMVDPQVGICIRQLTSGLVNLFIVLPLLGFMAGRVSISTNLIIQAFTSGPAMIWFTLSGLATFITFMTWYKGNSMCGAGLGTACNGTYSFFGPLFCYILLGVIFGMSGWALPSIVWIGAIVMVFGILVITINPLDLIKKKKLEVVN